MSPEPAAELREALAAYRRRDHEAAETLFRTVLKLDPHCDLAWRALGKLLAIRGALEEANAAARSAAELFPEDARAWRRYGSFCLALKCPGRALPAWERVAFLAPTDARAHYMLGALLYDADRMREAGASLGRAIGLRPDSAEAHYLLGFVHLSLNDPSSAAHQARVLHPLAPELADRLRRAIAPYRQQTVLFATVIVITLWLGAGKWFVPQHYAQAWQIAGFALFGLAFLLYRRYQNQAHPEGIRGHPYLARSDH